MHFLNARNAVGIGLQYINSGNKLCGQRHKVLLSAFLLSAKAIFLFRYSGSVRMFLDNNQTLE